MRLFFDRQAARRLNRRAAITTKAAATFVAAALFLSPVPFLVGCGGGKPPASVAVTHGVTFLRDERAGVQLLDVDLSDTEVRPVVVAAHVERRGDNFIGDAKTVREWAEETGAVGGMNAGFFGDTYDQVGRRKQIVQLALVDGKTLAPGARMQSSRTPGENYLRSAVGFGGGDDGSPSMTWASGNIRHVIRRHDGGPINQTDGMPWNVRWAVSCGPRLFADGKRFITDRDERLVSPNKVARAFVAYDWENGKPRHLILARADAMDYTQVAEFLTEYFNRVHQTTPRDAMCLDGGASAQIVYKNNGALEDAEPTGVLVPTAILLTPKKGTLPSP